MRILFVFDSFLIADIINLSSIDIKDEVYLFPLTSNVLIKTIIKDKIRSIGCKVEEVQTAKSVNLSADNLRDKYIKFIGEFPDQIHHKGKNLKKLFAIDKYVTLWWFSLISEKNTHKSNTFNKLAQFDSIISSIKHEKIDKIIFGCRNKKLRNALIDFSYYNPIKLDFLCVRQVKDFKIRISEIQNLFYLKHIFSLFYFAIQIFLRTWKIKRKLSKLRRLPVVNKPVMLVTYYPNIDVKLAKEGIFKNKYYAHLQESLEAEGRSIIWIAMYVHNYSIPFDESLRYIERFVKNNYNIFLLEEFNAVALQLKALFVMLVSGLKFIRIEKKIRRLHKFDEYNFYSIFRDDWFTSFVGSVGYFGYLYYEIFNSLLSKVKAKKCLYYCEMHAWEKALILSRSRNRTEMSLFGYQHATVPKMILNYFNDMHELSNDCKQYAMPQPDMIICNGKLPYSYLRSCGWPDGKLCIAEAIRYNYLKRYLKKNWNKTKNVILLAFSINPEESHAILNIVYEGLKNLDGIEVWVKPHPFLQIEKVFELSEISQKEVYFKIKDDPIENLLPEVKVIIVGESSVSIEALAFGCKVITVNTPEMVNMSPLRDVETSMVKNVSSVEELKQAVISIFEEKYDPVIHTEEITKIINEFFCFNEKSSVPERFLEILNL